MFVRGGWKGIDTRRERGEGHTFIGRSREREREREMVSKTKGVGLSNGERGRL